MWAIVEAVLGCAWHAATEVQLRCTFDAMCSLYLATSGFGAVAEHPLRQLVMTCGSMSDTLGVLQLIATLMLSNAVCWSTWQGR